MKLLKYPGFSKFWTDTTLEERVQQAMKIHNTLYKFSHARLQEISGYGFSKLIIQYAYITKLKPMTLAESKGYEEISFKIRQQY